MNLSHNRRTPPSYLSPQIIHLITDVNCPVHMDLSPHTATNRSVAILTICLRAIFKYVSEGRKSGMWNGTKDECYVTSVVCYVSMIHVCELYSPLPQVINSYFLFASVQFAVVMKMICGDESSKVTKDVLAVGVRSFSNVSLCIAVCFSYVLLFFWWRGICGLFFLTFLEA